MFNKKEELVSFCIVVDTLYVLTVNCNACILEGSLKPPECYLKITERGTNSTLLCSNKDMYVYVTRYMKICTSSHMVYAFLNVFCYQPNGMYVLLHRCAMCS